MADTARDEHLFLLTAAEAAAILGIDVKTLRGSDVPYVVISKQRRYTRALLLSWIERSVVTCQSDHAPLRGRRPTRSISPKGRGRLSGKPDSGSNLIAFEKAVGLRAK